MFKLTWPGAGVEWCVRGVVAVCAELIPTVIVAALACGSSAALAQTPTTAPVPDRQGMQDRLAACAFCHGEQGEGDLDRRGGVYPRLAGQPAGYLEQQMRQFVADQRTGIPPVALMRNLLRDLSPDYTQKIAQFYQDETPTYPPLRKYDPVQLQLGRSLVDDGLPAKQVPACTSCHGANLEGRALTTAALAGQNERYLTVQLMHWLQGQRHSELHQHIARALTQQQIEAVSAYLSSLRPANTPEASK